MRLHSVNVGVRTTASWSEVGWTGIDKRPVTHRVRITGEGVGGDRIADRRHHGGADKAVYAYAREDALWWSDELRQEIEPGGVGENLTTVGVDVTGAVIGELWTVGGAVLQVCQPRTPCRTFAGFLDVPDLIKRFTDRGAPGAYLRVLRDGDVGAGDPVAVSDRPAHGVTIGETFRALHRQPDLLPRLLVATALPTDMKARVQRRLAS
jgi:MOSC domain-containing protein YiiM